MKDKLTAADIKRAKEQVVLKNVADIAYDILQHGESFENRDKLKILLPILGYKVED